VGCDGAALQCTSQVRLEKGQLLPFIVREEQVFGMALGNRTESSGEERVDEVERRASLIDSNRSDQSNSNEMTSSP
jgi:hypothetical protein